jgi:hypothetical protein
VSTDFSIKPVGAPALRSAGKAGDNVIATELPAAQSVTAAGAGARVRNDPGAGDDVSHQAFVDRAAASIVYQVVDVRTNVVLRQFPDQSMLRRRAYYRALDLTRRVPIRPVVTDLMA